MPFQRPLTHRAHQFPARVWGWGGIGSPINAMHAFYIFCMLNALFPMLINGPSDFRDYVDNRSPLLNYLYIGIHIVYVPLLMSTRKVYSNLFTVLIIPTFITVLAIVSTIWSLDAARSIVVSLSLALQLLIVSYIVSTVNLGSFLKICSIACYAACVLSILIIFVLPSYGTMTFVFPGAWQGIFIHKNVLGRFAVFSAMVFVVLFRQTKSPIDASGLGLSLVLALGSGSATALIGVLGIGIVTVVSFYRRLIIPAAVAAMLAALFYLFNETEIQLQLAKLLGKSATLSGRTTIWASVLDAINARPATGYGMGAFWGSEYATRVRATAGWFVPHAHNGFLEVGLQLGYPGIFLIAAVIVQLGINSIGYITRYKIPVGTWPLYLLFFCVLYGAGEANFLRPNSFVQVVLYATIAYTASPRAGRWRTNSTRSLIGLPPQKVNVMSLDRAKAE